MVSHQIIMYLRFSTKIFDVESTRNLGVLVVAHELRDEGDISKEDHESLREMLEWFNKQLLIPKVLKDIQHRRAISWFKPFAKEPIKKMWELSEILKQYGIEVEVYKTDQPGTVIYEDDWQIVAKPKKGSKVPW